MFKKIITCLFLSSSLLFSNESIDDKNLNIVDCLIVEKMIEIRSNYLEKVNEAGQDPEKIYELSYWIGKIQGISECISLSTNQL